MSDRVDEIMLQVHGFARNELEELATKVMNFLMDKCKAESRQELDEIFNNEQLRLGIH